jgi:hypothetical protein
MDMSEQQFLIAWRKSSRSSGSDGCVECARLSEEIVIRDSKDPDGGTLIVSAGNWRLFLRSIKSGYSSINILIASIVWAVA